MVSELLRQAVCAAVHRGEYLDLQLSSCEPSS